MERYGFTHLSSGDLLRDEVASKSPRGNELNSLMQVKGLKAKSTDRLTIFDVKLMLYLIIIINIIIMLSLHDGSTILFGSINKSAI